MLLRRWYFVVAAVLVAVAGASFGLLGTPPTYESRTTLLMLPSATAAGDKNGPANPYTALSSSLADAGQVVAAQVMSDDSAQALAQQGAHALFTVAVDVDFNAPVIQIVSTGKTGESADTTLKLVTAAFTDKLQSVQLAAGAPQKTLISLSTVTTTPKPQKIMKKAIRNGIGGGVLGLLLGLLPIPLLDRRRVRLPRNTEPTEPATEQPTPAADGFGPTTQVVPGMQRSPSSPSKPSRRHGRSEREAQSSADKPSDARDDVVENEAPARRPGPGRSGRNRNRNQQGAGSASSTVVAGTNHTASEAEDEHAEDERLAATTRRPR
jgi:capsular polysaccharide biosynthesis protein